VAVISSDARRFVNSSAPQIEQLTSSTRNLVRDLDSISRDVKMLTQDIRGNLSGGQLYTIIAHFDSAAQSLNALATTTNQLLKQSKEDIRVTMENLRSASENANQLSQLLAENPSLLIRGGQQKQREIQ
jgi:ABC-type transporter Mla subunit MlaD